MQCARKEARLAAHACSCSHQRTPSPACARCTHCSLSRPQVVPILRAGLVLLEAASTVLPATETYHLGYVRDEKTLQVRCVEACWQQSNARAAAAAGRDATVLLCVIVTVSRLSR